MYTTVYSYQGAFSPAGKHHYRVVEALVNKIKFDGITEEMKILILFMPTPWSPESSFSPEKAHIAPTFYYSLQILNEMCKDLKASYNFLDFEASILEREFYEKSVELGSPKKPSTYDTVGMLKLKYPEAEIKLLLGEDNVSDFLHWNNSDKYVSDFNVSEIIFIPREDEIDINYTSEIPELSREIRFNNQPSWTWKHITLEQKIDKTNLLNKTVKQERNLAEDLDEKSDTPIIRIEFPKFTKLDIEKIPGSSTKIRELLIELNKLSKNDPTINDSKVVYTNIQLITLSNFSIDNNQSNDFVIQIISKLKELLNYLPNEKYLVFYLEWKDAFVKIFQVGGKRKFFKIIYN